MAERLSTLSPDVLHAKLVEKGEDWADTQAAADALEESRKSVLAQLTLKSEGKSHADRETQALASPDYALHVQAMVEARRVANRARVNYDAAKAWIEMMRSVESTKRAEMGLR